MFGELCTIRSHHNAGIVMRGSLRTSYWGDLRGVGRAFLSLAALALVSAVDGEAQERRILVLYPPSEIPAISEVSEGIRKQLASQTSLKVQTFREFLDLSWFP